VRRELEQLEIPGEHEARERTWAVVAAAHAAREPSRGRRRPWVAAVALALAGAVVTAAVSSPGRALLRSLREQVGVERAAPALFRLPAGGRLLVSSDGGVWVVGRDGGRRRLGAYLSASWSPHGRYVVATRRNSLYALTPAGEERWSLARPGVRFPRWAGSDVDTRIAYLTGSRLHVVAGDGRGDVDAGGLPAAARVPPAWRQSRRFWVAYADTRGRVTVYGPQAGAVLFRTAPLDHPRVLEWSRGDRLLVVTRTALELYGAQGQRVRRIPLRGVTAAAFAPDGRSIAIARGSELLLADVARRRVRRLFAGGSALAGVAWSPDGRWLLTALPAADQWVFVRASGGRIEAVSNVSAQFRSQRFPRVEGWCCAG